MVWNVGIDLVEIPEVRASQRAFGERYLRRVYTAAELADSGGDPRRLATRFAAKEAAMKALLSPDRLPWHSLAVVEDGADRPSLQLTGRAAELAETSGVRSLSLGVAADRRRVAAIVVAELAR